MKRKIVISLLAIFMLFSVGAAIAVIYVANAASGLNRVIEMHQVEQFRRDLLINTQLVQNSLYAVNTPLAEELDAIVEHFSRLEASAKKCTSCHHPPGVSDRISEIELLVGHYGRSLSFYITTRANSRRAHNLQSEAFQIGSRLLKITEDMSHVATEKIETEKTRLVQKIGKVKWALFMTVVVTLCLGIMIAIMLTKSVTRPIKELVDATRLISSGKLGSTTAYTDSTEFGELAAHFNSMSIAVKEGYENIKDEVRERLEVQSKLAKSEKFLSTIFDSIRDPFCIFDKDFNIVRANESYAAMKGTAVSNLEGKVCYEEFWGRDSTCEDCIVQKSLLSTDPCVKEKMVLSENDEKTWYEIYTYPIFDEVGMVSHIIEYTRDTTDRKLTEEALKTSEQRYMLAANGANDGLWDWLLESNVTYYSPRWKSMLGFETNEISETPDEWLSRVHPDDLIQLEQALSAHIEGRTPNFRSEHRILHKDGSYRWVLSRGLAVHDSSSKAYRIAGSMTDVTERKEAEEQLIYDALHDALTGLPNRTLFSDRLNHAAHRESRHEGGLFAVLFLDLDRFKVLNDSLGHATGDALLIQVSEKLLKTLRPGDTFARIGGDEFAILLEDIEKREEALAIAGRIRDQLKQPLKLNGREIYTSISIGIAFSSDSYEYGENLLRNADIAMYHAKINGNVSYSVFDNSMYATAVSRLQLETDLRRAIKNAEFCLHYQPIMSMKNRCLAGFEALVRWQHHDRGLLFPDDFISIAEETGLIKDLGQWVLQASCDQMKKWQSQFPDVAPATISVNISSQQLRPNFVDQIKQILNETGLGSANLVLEITETMIMEKAELIAPMLTELKALGVRIHIDDFGTGYSSLSYLHRFPFDLLKIDRSFVHRLGDNRENLEIVRAIMTLANSLNMDVIAEGVETESQLLQLEALGCQYMQGYLISRPLDVSHIERALKKDGADWGRIFKTVSTPS